MSSLYPHLTGDLDANPDLLRRLELLAQRRGELWTITSGKRTIAEQQHLWDHADELGLVRGVTVAAPGSSRHQSGNAADVVINGQHLWKVVPAAQLERAGLGTFPGGQTKDDVHVELASARTSTGAPSSSSSSGGGFHIGIHTGIGPIDAIAGAVTAPINAASDAASVASDVAGFVSDPGKGVLTIALVLGGAAIAGLGLARMVGARAPVPQGAST